MGRLLFNDTVSNRVVGPDPGRGPAELHKRLPGYQPTPLRRLPELASRLGVGEVILKDESDRFGLPAFKILGASWAAYRATVQWLGHEPPPGWFPARVEQPAWALFLNCWTARTHLRYGYASASTTTAASSSSLLKVRPTPSRMSRLLVGLLPPFGIRPDNQLRKPHGLS